MGATTSTAARPWQDLPPDVVREISDHLHTAIDLVRFHAVCKPWRNAFDRDRASRHPPSLLPWLMAPSDKQHCRCVFSRTSYRAPLRICVREREDRRVACADGTAAWLVRGKDEEDWLVNPLTAARLPGVSLGDSRHTNGWLDRTHGVVSGDGTILVYGGLAPCTYCPRQHALLGLILKPGHKEWQPVELYTGSDNRRAVAYHDNVAVDCTLDYCHVNQPFRFREAVRLPDDPAGKFCWRRHLVEFRGELLLASVLYVAAPVNGRVTHVWSVSLHALDLKAESSPDAACVIRDCDAASLLRDHVLFLGFPSSFAVEAARFGGEVSGGTAYFVVERAGRCCVYRYDFRVGKTTMMQELPRRWGDESCMWFLPQPDIAPVVTRPLQLRIYAGDLPPSMGNSRLQEMFSEYGKVASALIAYDKKGRSKGFGFVTMATQEGFDRAIAAHAVEEPRTAGFSKSVVTIVVILLLLMSFAYYYVFGQC